MNVLQLQMQNIHGEIYFPPSGGIQNLDLEIPYVFKHIRTSHCIVQVKMAYMLIIFSQKSKMSLSTWLNAFKMCLKCFKCPKNYLG